ncbi:hypothetical protein INQ51_22445 [Maribellus sp. CM-23]|nr:hypothetical protein [Maribellus sp. CM-23]
MKKKLQKFGVKEKMSTFAAAFTESKVLNATERSFERGERCWQQYLNPLQNKGSRKIKKRKKLQKVFGNTKN